MGILKFRNQKIQIGHKTLIMGIVNITPDSFSDGGKFLNPKEAVNYAKLLVKAGADIIDIGGESTKPFSEGVSYSEEISRVIPVIRVLSEEISVPISIDTTKADVANEAILAGASIVNDISALNFDPNMAQVIAQHNAGVVLMHMKGKPKNMQINPNYDNLLREIKFFLSLSIDKALKAGISKSSIIIDPGIGFGKTINHNLEIIRKLDELLVFNLPILIGSSRKAFIRKILNTSKNNLEISSDLVETGTQATVAVAVMNGADIVRVHNVYDTFATLKLLDLFKRY